MKVAHIVPIPHLEEFVLPSTGMHLVIAPLILDSDKYRDFYRKRSEEGDFVIVDPGTYEFPETEISIDIVIEAAKAIEASEIILPDCYMSAEKTEANMREYLPKARESGFRVMGIPQGIFLLEYIACLRLMLETPGIDTIGFAFGPIERSLDFLAADKSVLYQYLRPGILCTLQWPFCMFRGFTGKKQFHCLGLGGDPRELWELNKLRFIRSCDTSAAFTYGWDNVELFGAIPEVLEKRARPSNFFHYNLADSLRRHKIRKNIGQMNRWAKGK